MEAEQREVALTKSSAPSTPGTTPSQSDKSPALTPVHSDPQFSSSPVKNIMNELLDKPVSPAPVPTFNKMFDVPLPKQGEFNGTMAWEGFIRPFMSLAYERVKLETVNNELIEVDGIATMDISIGEQQFQWDAFVAPIKDEGILGYDFFYFFDCILEARRGIRIAGTWVQWTIKRSPPCVMPISLKENTTVPACSEWIAGGVADTHKLSSNFAVVEAALNKNID